MKYKIPFIKPTFPTAQELAEDYEQIVSSNWYTNFGPFEQRFRKEVGDYVGQDIEACLVSSATAGLEIAIRLLFQKEADKKQVIMPSFTFAAGLEVVLGQGFEPVLIDIDENWQPDVAQAQQHLQQSSAQVSGILLGNSFGVGNPRIEDWEKLSANYNVPLVVDSAAGYGSLYTDGTKLGAHGRCEVFSFHATKPFAIGEGGAITSRDAAFIENCRKATNFGFGADRKASILGTNAKLEEIKCAIGLRQLSTYDDRLVARRQALMTYKDRLATTDCTFQANDETSTVPFVSVKLATTSQRDAVRDALLANTVDVKSYYDPIHQHPIAHDPAVKSLGLDTTDMLADTILALPLHDTMSYEHIAYITDLIHDAR